MLETRDESAEYVIEIVSQQNPIRVTLPVIPGKIENDKARKLLAIDSSSFTVIENTTAPANFISAKSDFVEILFANGFGCFNHDGKMTKVLEIMSEKTEVVTSTYTKKSWALVGGSDLFQWSTGYELELGFADVDENPLDFGATGLNTWYELIIEINIE